MILRNLIEDGRWQSTHKGFQFPKANQGRGRNPVVWKEVTLTNKGKYRVTRTVNGSWNKRVVTRYVQPDQAVVLVPLSV